MKSSVINISREDWNFMRMLKGNIKWMKNQPDPQVYLISTRKEEKLLQDYIKMYG